MNADGAFADELAREQERLTAEARQVLRVAGVAAARHLLRVIEDPKAEAADRLRASVAVTAMLPRERFDEHPLDAAIRFLGG